jgi:hypothetical protein
MPMSGSLVAVAPDAGQVDYDIPDWNTDPSPWAAEVIDIADDLDSLAMNLNTKLLDGAAARLRKLAAQLPNR